MKTCGDDQMFPDSTASGLTKREYFAAMALQGFCSADWTEDDDFEHVAACSVAQSDALIAALNKVQKTGTDDQWDLGAVGA